MDQQQKLSILQVNTSDSLGGAEKVVWNLLRVYRARGYASWLAVGYKRTDDPDVFAIRNEAAWGGWAGISFALGNAFSPLVGKVRGAGCVRNLLHRIAQPQRLLDWWKGVEDFNFPGSWRLLEIPPARPDIVHCHNLHGDYFDLQALSWLGQQVAVVLTLHDAWLLSGHCAHSFDCERWKTGCGHCPDLTIYPAIRRDATAYNWQRKREIYAKSRLYVATPSRWLMQKVEQSLLASAMVEARVIPNGVDLSVFHPVDRETVRARLALPQSAKVLLFSAKGIRRNIWKDYQTIRAAVALVGERLHGQSILFIALGEDAPAERIGQAEVRFVPYQNDPEAVARYYQAADVYVHAARADTFPNTVLEALACGTPVVATAVGGITEQVEDTRTGFLVPAGDAEALAFRLTQVLSDIGLRRRMNAQAAETAMRRFDLNRQVDTYLEWFQDIVKNRACAP